jgi:hypothetical protein
MPAEVPQSVLATAAMLLRPPLCFEDERQVDARQHVHANHINLNSGMSGFGFGL